MHVLKLYNLRAPDLEGLISAVKYLQFTHERERGGEIERGEL